VTLQFDEQTARRIEALYASPDAIRRRSHVLQLLEPRSEERILDIGCGPGFLAAELGTAVGCRLRHRRERPDARPGLARAAALLGLDPGRDAARLEFEDGT
jgi:SAM-dependent methyltransferase